MKPANVFVAVSVAVLLGGCNVFVGNAERGQLFQPCFEDGTCEGESLFGPGDLSCVGVADMCAPSCRVAISNVYEANCVFLDQDGRELPEEEVYNNCQQMLEEAARNGCFYVAAELVSCMQGRIMNCQEICLKSSNDLEECFTSGPE